MAAISVITLSALENFLDWSPEYYRQDFLSLANSLRKWPTIKVGSVAFVTDGEHGSPEWDENSGIRYITAEHIRPNEILDSEMRTISRRQDSRNSRCRLREGDVLVYSVGAYSGFAACAEPHLFPASIPRSVAIIRLNEHAKINPAFLSVFLNSKFGLFQSYRFRAGNSQPVLALEKIRKYEIPLVSDVFQEKIEELYSLAYRSRCDSRGLVHKAQSLLESEFGLDKLSCDKSIRFGARFSEVSLGQTISANRIDAQCFSPSALQYEQALAKLQNVKPLRLLTASMLKGAQQEESSTGKIPYASIKHIRNNEIVTEGSSLSFDGMPISYRNDLLLAITGATIGKIGLVSRYEELTFSGDMLAIRANGSIDPHYLLAVLSHCVGQVQLQRWITGSTNGHLSPHDVGRVLVPRLDKETESKIASLMKESIDKTHESERLLNQAKRLVEELIGKAIAA